ncbi:hypothetical protein [Zobellia laminariae]|uniref:hypothetical protein n=1 Tax=Zobellia laminariae TaxID=248906 RepID=UPI0026F47098|nr:hypothetical protein [Zobellia laminariae]WKX77196.1 hypothetical protein Q5W13_03490 [Zobellia laminariae]
MAHGAVGQVLTTDASGQTVWGTGGGSGTDEQNIEGSVLTDQLLTIGIENGTGQDVDLSSFATEVELTAAVAASAELPTGGASGNVLSTDGAGVYSWIAASGGLATVTTSASFTGDGTATSELDIANDVITTDELAIDAVIEENILDEAVTSAKIANNTIAIEDLSPMGADTDGQILKWNNTLTTWEIGTDDGAAASTPYTAGAGLDLSATNVFSVNDLVGDVTGPTSATVIATDAITADKIATGAVNTDEIAAGAVVTTSIANNNVTPDKISEGADGEVLTTDSSGDVVWAPVSGANLSTTNLTQTEVIRTYEIGTGQSLVFTGPGSVGFGNGANPPLDKFHFAGEVRVEGVNSAGGTVGAPAYSFSTSDDGNTGMFRPAADEIGFSVGGVEALHIEEDGNLTNVTVTGAFSTKIRRENSGGAITIADDDHTVIIISGTSVNLPAPAANTGKIYILKNSTGGPIPIDSYRTSNGIASINLNAVVLQLQSDGVEWQQIN